MSLCSTKFVVMTDGLHNQVERKSLNSSRNSWTCHVTAEPFKNAKFQIDWMKNQFWKRICRKVQSNYFHLKLAQARKKKERPGWRKAMNRISNNIKDFHNRLSIVLQIFPFTQHNSTLRRPRSYRKKKTTQIWIHWLKSFFIFSFEIIFTQRKFQMSRISKKGRKRHLKENSTFRFDKHKKSLNLIGVCCCFFAVFRFSACLRLFILRLKNRDVVRRKEKGNACERAWIARGLVEAIVELLLWFRVWLGWFAGAREAAGSAGEAARTAWESWEAAHACWKYFFSSDGSKFE